MALENPSQINISLATTAVSQTGFGVPAFINEHKWSFDRVLTFTSLESAQQALPADSVALAGVSAFFANTVKPTRALLIRREADGVVLTPEAASLGKEYKLEIEAKDGSTATFTLNATGVETSQDIIDALEADTGITALVNVADTSGTATITENTQDYIIKSSKGFDVEFTTTETAATVLAEAKKVNNDFYAFSASDHSIGFVSAMTDAVGAETKLYFWSTQQANDLEAWNGEDAPTTLSEIIADKGELRSIGMFHHQADTLFPENRYIGRFLPKQPGQTYWLYKELNGIAAARNPTTGNVLTSTELENLCKNKNLSYVADYCGVDVVWGGLSTKGERIKILTSRDFLEARLKEAVANQKIRREDIPYTAAGINDSYSVIRTVLNRYVSNGTQSNILSEDNPYELNVPNINDASFSDKVAGRVCFTGSLYLAGSILLTKVDLTLTYDAAA